MAAAQVASEQSPSPAKDTPAPRCRWGPPGEHPALFYDTDATNGPLERRHCYVRPARNSRRFQGQLHPAFEPNRHSRVQTIRAEQRAGSQDALSPRGFASVPDQNCPTQEESRPSQSPFSVTATWTAFASFCDVCLWLHDECAISQIVCFPSKSMATVAWVMRRKAHPLECISRQHRTAERSKLELGWLHESAFRSRPSA